jgi:O-antigen/teichoic acid export membrane protein
LLKSLLDKYLNFFSGSTRSVKAKKNILFLFIIHSFNFVLILLLVPISLKCLTTSEYGIWLTLTSIIAWFISLDFGLGNGLRNKLAEALAINDLELAKTYTSTAYAYLTLFLTLFYFIFVIFERWLNWTAILNAPQILSSELENLVFVVFTLFFINFILKLIVVIPIADQRPAINGLLSFLINLLTVGAIYLLSFTEYASLFYLGTISSIIPGIIYVVATLIFFSGKYKAIKPSLKFVKAEYSRKLLTLGFRFFIIQIGTLIIFATDNIIITQILSPADVTVYNIAHKYFYTLWLVFGIILTPFWSAYTEAFTKKDFAWIKNVNRRLIRIWGVFVLIIIGMLIVSPIAYRIWIGSAIQVSNQLSAIMAFFVVITMWNNLYAYFINGVGKIQIQLYYAIIAGLFNIPLSILFAKYLLLGTSGVILATVICLLPAAFIAPIQYSKIVNGRAHGIWDR